MRLVRSIFARARPAVAIANVANIAAVTPAAATSPHNGERVGAYDELTARACRYAADAYLDPVPAHRALVSDRGTDAQAVVEIAEDGTAVVAFRGSESHKDWVHNAMVPLRPLPSPHRSSVRAHAGFLRQYASLHARLLKLLREHEVKHVTLCGHSLGGALAVIAAAMLPEKVTCDVVTFGAPRAGNEELSAAAFSRCVECVRVVHDRDVVPTVPLGVMGYAHVCDDWLHLDERGFVTEKPRERSMLEQLWLRVRGFVTGDFGVRDHFMCKYLRGTAQPEGEADPATDSTSAETTQTKVSTTSTSTADVVASMQSTPTARVNPSNDADEA